MFQKNFVHFIIKHLTRAENVTANRLYTCSCDSFLRIKKQEKPTYVKSFFYNF